MLQAHRNGSDVWPLESSQNILRRNACRSRHLRIDWRLSWRGSSDPSTGLRSLSRGVRIRHANNPVYGSADFIGRVATTFFPPMMNALEIRKPDHPIESLFVERWSPRAMSGEPLSDGEILTLFEAARWAPSTYNEQEWRFLYARRETPQWPLLFDLLIECNQSWCKNAALVDGDCGPQSVCAQRQAEPGASVRCRRGVREHRATGHGDGAGRARHGGDSTSSKARTTLKVPDDYAVAAMFAAGRPAPVDVLPEKLREREKPTDRKPVTQIICEGAFAF